MDNISGEKQFIISIFKQAIVDILNCPHASPDPEMKYAISSPYYFSADAKRFLSKDNFQFKYLCGLLDLEPEYAEKKFLSYIKKETLIPSMTRHNLNLGL